MGGVPTNFRSEVLIPSEGNTEEVCQGLMAIGEGACASVHGANRLGTNALAELLVFGKGAAIRASEILENEKNNKTPNQNQTDEIINRFDSILFNKGDISAGQLREKMQKTVQSRFGVYREANTLALGNDELARLSSDLSHIEVKDKSSIFNTDIIEALELHNLMQISRSVGASAINRTESRGAHAREDYPNRDDDNWMNHSIVWMKDDEFKVTKRPVRMTTISNQAKVIAPEVRVY
jgi:succinate dehydrogenase / fumarate reductase flavoprotein subunit